MSDFRKALHKGYFNEEEEFPYEQQLNKNSMLIWKPDMVNTTTTAATTATTTATTATAATATI